MVRGHLHSLLEINIHRKLTLTLLFILVTAICAQAADKLTIYTVNYPLAYFAERIGSEQVEVVFPAPADVDPAFWMPDKATIAAYQQAYLEYFILFIGKDFREGVGIVPVVLMANLVMGIFFNLSIWYKLTNKTHFGAILVILGAVITVVINVLFIPQYGYVASAWAHLICYSVMVVVSFAWSRKHYAVPYKTLRIASYISVAVVFFFLNELFLQNMERMKEVFGLLLLGIFSGWAIYRERSVFNAYKRG